jgi:Domain of unknown function (DUF5668)
MDEATGSVQPKVGAVKTGLRHRSGCRPIEYCGISYKNNSVYKASQVTAYCAIMQLFVTTKDFTMKGNFAAIVLIVLGGAFLLNNLGLLNFSLTEVLRVWWPVVLIAVGAAMFLMPRDKTDNDGKR